MAEKNNALKGSRKALVSFFLRIGIAIVFLYASISAFLNPVAWGGFIPPFVKAIISVETFLLFHSILNIVLCLWLLSDKKTFYASIISSIAIFFIVIFNIGSLDILFRDVAIFFAAIALAILSYEKR